MKRLNMQIKLVGEYEHLIFKNDNFLRFFFFETNFPLIVSAHLTQKLVFFPSVSPSSPENQENKRGKEFYTFTSGNWLLREMK